MGAARRTATLLKRAARSLACLSVLAIVMTLMRNETETRQASQSVAPEFRVDPFWPRPLPNHWLVGAVVGVAVDRRDHVWITHRPSTLQPNETRSIWKAAPPVLEFDADGTLVSSWGGPGIRLRVAAARARHSRRRSRQCVARRRRRQGRTDSEVHASRTIPDADRAAGKGPGQQRHRESRRRREHGRGPRHATSCMWPMATSTIA